MGIARIKWEPCIPVILAQENVNLTCIMEPVQKPLIFVCGEPELVSSKVNLFCNVTVKKENRHDKISPDIT